MSGYFKDTGEMVGDIRGGFRAGAPVAAAAGMFSLTVCYELVKTAFLSWRAMLFWKTLISALLVALPLHIALLYGPAFTIAHKFKTFDYIVGELIIYVNISISYFYYRTRFREIEKQLSLDVDKLHTKILLDAIGRGLKIFLPFTILFLAALWVISLFPWFKGDLSLRFAYRQWWVLGSDKSLTICYYWLLISLFGIWLYCILNFKSYATEYITDNAIKEENESIVQFEDRKNKCISTLEWSWSGVRSIVTFQLKLLLGLMFLTATIFAALYVTKQLGIWR